MELTVVLGNNNVLKHHSHRSLAFMQPRGYVFRAGTSFTFVLLFHRFDFDPYPHSPAHHPQELLGM
jgi:hypothetical protein